MFQLFVRKRIGHNDYKYLIKSALYTSSFEIILLLNPGSFVYQCDASVSVLIKSANALFHKNTLFL